MMLSKHRIVTFSAVVVACILLTALFGFSWISQTSTSRNAPTRSVADFSLASLDRLGGKILARQDLTNRCGARAFGSGWGHHVLCTHPMQLTECFFYSFGISKDYSFDIDMANSTRCHGFAADPTVTHPSKLHPRVFFTQMAATAYDPEDTAQFPLRTSVPALRKLLGHDHVTVLKMDCEGCEYALARDILEQDPDFFSRVDQFAVEVHYSKRWMKTIAHLHALAALVELLEDAGMDLVHFDITGCSGVDQATGIIEEMKTVQLFDALRPNGQDMHCHNYLFARV